MSFNYCIIPKNNIYEEFHDLLEDNGLYMGSQDDDYEITYKIKKNIKDCSYISYSEKYDDKEKMLDSIIHSIAIDDSMNKVYADTVLLFSNEDVTYELMHVQHNKKDEIDVNLNHFATMSNCDMQPIYGKCAIIKTKHMKDKCANDIITTDDVYDIAISNFYHKGIMIDGEEMTEIEYASDNPLKKIGNNFQNNEIINIFGFNFICYYDNCENNKDNNISSKFCGKLIKKRMFVALLSFMRNKKIWNVTKSLIKKIYDIRLNEQLCNKINNEVANSPNENYFVILSKY